MSVFVYIHLSDSLDRIDLSSSGDVHWMMDGEPNRELMPSLEDGPMIETDAFSFTSVSIFPILLSNCHSLTRLTMSPATPRERRNFINGSPGHYGSLDNSLFPHQILS